MDVEKHRSVIERALGKADDAIRALLEYQGMSYSRRLIEALKWSRRIRAEAEILEAAVIELLRRAKGEELVTPENQREMISPTYDGTSGLDCTAEQLEAAMGIH